MPFRFFHGHFNISDFDYVPKPTRAITLIREPRKRIQSLYNFWRSHKREAFSKYEPHHPALTKTVGFSSFLRLPNPSIRVTINNALVQAYLPYPLRGRNGALAASEDVILDDALQAVDKMAAFGVLERFGDSMKAISAELQTSLILPAEKVRGFETLSASDRHELIEREASSPEIEDLLDSHTELDRVFYDRAVKLFETKFGRHLQAGVAAPASGSGDAPRIAAHVWGDWINFGADFYLDGISMTGWSSQEEWGIWSITKEPSLRIGPLPKANGTIRLTIAARAAVFSTHPTQTITILRDRRPVESWEFIFEPDNIRSIKVLNLPSSAIDADGFLNLTFRVRQPISLQMAGISQDLRELGLGLESIHLECFG